MLRFSDFRRVALPAAFAGAMSLGGCSVYQDEVYGSFSESALTSAGAGPGIAIQVDGKVGSAQGDKLATIVAAAMPVTIGDAKVRYAPCKQFTECPGDHIVWTFGPPSARPASAYPPALATNVGWIWGEERSPNNVTVKVAVFQGGNVVATAAGQVDAADPNDPAFKDLIESMSDSVLSAPGLIDRYSPF